MTFPVYATVHVYTNEVIFARYQKHTAMLNGHPIYVDFEERVTHSGPIFDIVFFFNFIPCIYLFIPVKTGLSVE